MLSLAAVFFVIVATAAVSTGQTGHLLGAAPRIGLVLVVVNLIGARFLFGPVRRYLADAGTLALAQQRIRRLPLLSGGWAFLQILLLTGASFLYQRVFCPSCGSTLLPSLVFALAVLTANAACLGLALYFLIGNYTAWLRKTLYQRFALVIEPGRGRILHKLMAAFLAASILPLGLLLLKATFVDHLPRRAVLDTTQIVQTDILVSILLASVAIVFITRNLTGPVSILHGSIKELNRGNLGIRVPVVSDDELGALTLRFNDLVVSLEEREFLRKVFGQYVPASVASAVLENRGIVEPRTAEATILFTDIERFSTVCEHLAPEQVLSMLNDYFEVAAGPIHEHGGVITQFQGDAILASFNMPVTDADHAGNAVRAAMEMHRRLEERRFADGIALKTRIGINTGLVVGGTVGDGDRLGFTVHGDTVNLAARLEQLNKEYGTQLLASERTVELAGQAFQFRRIGEVTVRGRQSPVTVYELAQD